MTQEPFDFEKTARDRKLAQFLRDLGIDRAAEGADTEFPKWSEIAYAALETYARGAAGFGVLFTAEDVREWAEEQGLPTPTEQRAWGGIFQRASRAKLIEPTGVFVVARDPKVHCNNIRQWRSRRT